MKHFALLLIFMLAACGADEAETTLSGPRIDLTPQAQTLEPDPGADLQPLQLPRPVANEHWPQAGLLVNHAPQHLALPEQVLPAWNTSVGNFARYALNPPVKYAQLLYTVDEDHRVRAVNAENGKVVWQQQLPVTEDGDGFAGGLAVDKGAVFITTRAGQVFALERETGELAWQRNVGAAMRAAPVTASGFVFVTTLDNRTFALRREDGSLQWTHSGIADGLALVSSATPALSDGILFVPYNNGDLYALQALDGQYLWHVSLTRGIGSGQKAALSSPVVKDGVAYVAVASQGLVALDIRTGQRLWSVPAASSQMPWVAGNVVFILTDKGQLAAVNRGDGRIRWVTNLNSLLPADANPARYWSGPLLAGQRLLLGSSDGYAMSIQPEDGRKILATELLAGEGISVPPIVADNALYFLTDSGRVYKFE